jgi:hypothetical protein
VVTDAYPRGWSSDGRYLSLTADYGTQGANSRFDAATGSVTPAVPPTPQPRPVGSLLPYGSSPAPPQLRLLVDGYTAALVRDGGAEDECWCPEQVRLSPDRRRVSALLRYGPGLVAGTTDQKVHRHPEGTPQVVVIDAGTGQVTHRIPLAETDTSRWTLAADTGAGLLLWQGTGVLVRLEISTGAVQPVMRVPDARMVVLPGEYGLAGDG